MVFGSGGTLVSGICVWFGSRLMRSLLLMVMLTLLVSGGSDDGFVERFCDERFCWVSRMRVAEWVLVGRFVVRGGRCRVYREGVVRLQGG